MPMTPYLYFKGDCESALAFYTACGLGHVRQRLTYEGTPLLARHGDDWRDRTLHALFEGPSVRFYASDGLDSEPMKGCALLLETGDLAEATSWFDSLSEGGRVTVSPGWQAWGGYYGNWTDRFGVQWAIGLSPDTG